MSVNNAAGTIDGSAAPTVTPRLSPGTATAGSRACVSIAGQPVKERMMPKQYEAMRDKFAGGAKKDSPAYNRAQAKAAAIYNAAHPKSPVTNKKHK
jgi:hypothetical protein